MIKEVVVLFEYFLLIMSVAYSKLQQTAGEEKSGNASLQAEVTWFTKVAWNVALLCGEPCQEMYQLFLACYKVTWYCNYKYNCEFKNTCIWDVSALPT